MRNFGASVYSESFKKKGLTIFTETFILIRQFKFCMGS